MQAWSWGVAQFICLPGMCSGSTRILCICLCICCAYFVHMLCIFCAHFLCIFCAYLYIVWRCIARPFVIRLWQASTQYDRIKSLHYSERSSRLWCQERSKVHRRAESHKCVLEAQLVLQCQSFCTTAPYVPRVEHDVEHVQFQSHLFQLQRVRCLRPVFGCSTECRVPPMGRQIHDAK
jgi:hypothetical protein